MFHGMLIESFDGAFSHEPGMTGCRSNGHPVAQGGFPPRAQSVEEKGEEVSDHIRAPGLYNTKARDGQIRKPNGRHS